MPRRTCDSPPVQLSAAVSLTRLLLLPALCPVVFHRFGSFLQASPFLTHRLSQGWDFPAFYQYYEEAKTSCRSSVAVSVSLSAHLPRLMLLVSLGTFPPSIFAEMTRGRTLFTRCRPLLPGLASRNRQELMSLRSTLRADFVSLSPLRFGSPVPRESFSCSGRALNRPRSALGRLAFSFLSAPEVLPLFR